jgi:hypothetical protein
LVHPLRVVLGIPRDLAGNAVRSASDLSTGATPGDLFRGGRRRKRRDFWRCLLGRGWEFTTPDSPDEIEK